jgi:hypothetical protein
VTAISDQRSAISYQLSAFSLQRSAFSLQRSADRIQGSTGARVSLAPGLPNDLLVCEFPIRAIYSKPEWSVMK